MDLQAIKEKLQSLQVEPPAAEALSLPWTEPGHYGGSALGVSGAGTTQSNNPSINNPPTDSQSAQEIAIEALKQRSRGAESAAARTEYLVTQELYRLEVQANLINEQSQRQAESIVALKRSAQQASIGLRQQGVQHHPQLEIITQFLERYSSAAVPHIERDDHGHFALSYDTISFQRAEQDAAHTAQALRDRAYKVEASKSEATQSESARSENARSEDALQASLFSKEISSSSYSSTHLSSSHSKSRLQKSIGNTLDRVLYLFNPSRKRKIAKHRRSVERLAIDRTEGEKIEGLSSRFTASGMVASELEEGFITDSHFDAQFSWLDGMIWFSGAAIARIVVQAIALSYPIVQTLFVIAIASTITFALYKVVIARSNDYSLIYRLCIAMLGLLLAGFYSFY